MSKRAQERRTGDEPVVVKSKPVSMISRNGSAKQSPTLDSGSSQLERALKKGGRRYSALPWTLLGMKQKKTSMIYRSQEKCTTSTTRRSGRFLRTQSIGSILEKHKSKDYNSGRQRSHDIVLYDSVPADCVEKVDKPSRRQFCVQGFPRRNLLRRSYSRTPGRWSKANCQAGRDRLRTKTPSTLIFVFKEFHKMQHLKRPRKRRPRLEKW